MVIAIVDYSDCVIVRTDTWEELLRLSGHSITITDVVFNADGTLLASEPTALAAGRETN